MKDKQLSYWRPKNSAEELHKIDEEFAAALNKIDEESNEKKEPPAL